MKRSLGMQEVYWRVICMEDEKGMKQDEQEEPSLALLALAGKIQKLKDKDFGEACAAHGAREPAGRSEHEPQDVPALHPGEGLRARVFLLGLHALCGGLHPLPLLPATATGAVLLP